MSVNATQVPQDPAISLLTLIGTWALVVVATITVVVTAWQTRKGQRMLNKQVEQSIVQTELQRQQFTELLRGEERPRTRAQIRRVLTPAIQVIENNNAEIVGGYLNRKNYPVTSLARGSDSVAKLEFESFKSKYPEVWKKVKAYDELSVDIENKKAELRNILSEDVKTILATALKEYDEHHFLDGTVKIGINQNDIVPEQFVSDAILPALEQKLPHFRSTFELFWELQRDKFMGLTKREKASQSLQELRKLAQRSHDDGVKLAMEMSQLREKLGSEYKIPTDDYFVKPGPVVLSG